MAHAHRREPHRLHFPLQGRLSEYEARDEQLLSEGSAELDPAISLPSIKSFKVTVDLGLAMAKFSQMQRDLIRSVVQVTIAPAFEVWCLERPAQKKAREEFEASAGFLGRYGAHYHESGIVQGFCECPDQGAFGVCFASVRLV